VNIVDLIQQDVSLKRVSSTGGGEYAGACPWCGGKDRFRVWPEGGNYWCRQCNRKGDAIQYLRDYRGKSYQEAATLIGKPLEDFLARPSLARTVEVRTADAYERWIDEASRETWSEWDEWRLDVQLAEFAYRAIQRQPEAYAEDSLWWEQRLAQFYAQQHTLEDRLDILTLDPMRKTERVALFAREAARHG